MPRKPAEPLAQLRERLVRVAEHGADIDAAWSTVQRMEIGAALRQAIRRQRAESAKLVLRLVDHLDPDNFVDDARLDLLTGLPIDPDEADDGRLGGEGL